MQTSFSLAQLADPDVQVANRIVRTCVHCGFCLATCPTYQLLGDELDSPRGRIYLIKDLLESGRAPDARVATHLDRCLSCLSCMTTCPASVDYMHLVDIGRRKVEEGYRRPPFEQALREALARLLPYPRRFRAVFALGRLGRPLLRLLPGRLGAMGRLLPRRLPPEQAEGRPGAYPAQGTRRARVALHTGCVQQALAPEINAATIRLLTRHGVEVVVSHGLGCCGALVHHLGREGEALEQAKANVAVWQGELDGAGLDAILSNASGCGTMVKDYGFLFRGQPAWAERAARVSALARDVSEFLAERKLLPEAAGAGAPRLKVAYHAACSLQHGQRVRAEPRALLAAAGFALAEIPEGHLCCGSAGTYNLLQPKLASALKARKLAHIDRLGVEAVATGNIGCMTQLARPSLPVVHTVELLDWATGGPPPPALAGRSGR